MVTPPPTPPERGRARLASGGGEGAAHAEVVARFLSTMIGRTLGPYVVVRRLGGGAMASVYSARDQRTQTPVALKVLLPDADETVRARFRLEAQMVSQLNHPHIVRTFEVADQSDDGRETDPLAALGAESPTWIAMELVEGENLGDLLDRVRTLHAVDAATLLAPVARALAYAHARNVVHRDVKPSNILLRRASGTSGGSAAVRLTVLDYPVTPLLSDFGIARALDAPDLTSAGRTIGTPAYMAPEQCAGSREIDGRADIYSLGAVLYRTLVGRSPYSGSTTQILYAHVYEPLTMPEDVLLKLPPLLVEVLRRALAKDPADRYADAAQMADDLDLCSGRVSSHGPVTQPSPPQEPTATMSALDSTTGAIPAAPPTATGTIVLVPGPLATGSLAPVAPPAAALPRPAEPFAPRTLPVAPLAEVPPVAAIYPPSEASHWPGQRWRGLLVALSLAIPMLVLIGLAVTALLNLGPFSTATARETPQGVVQEVTPAVQARPTGQSVARATPDEGPVQSGGGRPGFTPTAQPRATATTAPATETPAATQPALPAPMVLPTPAGDIAAFWEEAQLFYEDRDWGSALSWLTLVQRINPQFEQTQVQRLLGDVLTALATAASRRGDWELAAQQFRRALDLQPQNVVVRSLLSATVSYAETVAAGSPATANAQRLLQIAHSTAGERLLRENRICDAADQYAAAAAILPESRTEAAAADSAQRCTVLQVARADQRLLQSLSGRLIYSTQLADGRYAIYSVATTPGSTPTLLQDDARQPGLSSDGQWLAFHNTRQGATGLWIREQVEGADPRRVSTGTRDAADSPPWWNFAGTELVYSGIDAGDLRARIYRADVLGDQVVMLIQGQSPTWNWSLDRIVYNGQNEAGRMPGLYMIRPDGSPDGLLTDNGNDLRPTFAPDGRTMAFMSSGRSNSWDVFLLRTADGLVTPITTDQAQDGLPTFSPDGRFIAWVSDRGGRWNIWVQAVDTLTVIDVLGSSSIALGEPRELLLAPVQGTLTSWLEHGLQWVADEETSEDEATSDE